MKGDDTKKKGGERHWSAIRKRGGGIVGDYDGHQWVGNGEVTGEQGKDHGTLTRKKRKRKKKTQS